MQFFVLLYGRTVLDNLKLDDSSFLVAILLANDDRKPREETSMAKTVAKTHVKGVNDLAGHWTRITDDGLNPQLMGIPQWDV